MLRIETAHDSNLGPITKIIKLKVYRIKEERRKIRKLAAVDQKALEIEVSFADNALDTNARICLVFKQANQEKKDRKKKEKEKRVKSLSSKGIKKSIKKGIEKRESKKVLSFKDIELKKIREKQKSRQRNAKKRRQECKKDLIAIWRSDPRCRHLFGELVGA